MNDFKFCPECGGRNVSSPKGRKWLCADCGFELYNNVASAVGLIIRNKEGRILLEKRAKEPRRGFLAFPGGFVDPDETAEEAAFRECFEEIGVKPAALRYIGSEPNTYEFKAITYKTCDLFFEAVLPPDVEFKIQESEVQAVDFVKIESENDIEKTPLAFESAKKILKLWLSRDN